MNNPLKRQNKIERLDYIRTILEKDRTIRTELIRKECNVSDQTARKDLEELARQGFCEKNYGGATLLHSNPRVHSNYRDRFDHISAKIVLEINRKHNELFRNTDSIFLSGNPTFFRELLANSNNLFDKDTTIYTNSIIIAKLLSEKKRNKTILLPGQIDSQRDVTTGQETLTYLNQLHKISTLIITPNYFEENSLSSFVGFETEQEGIIARTLIKEKLSKNIIFIAAPNVLKEKKAFHQFRISKKEVSCLVQALWEDEKEHFQIPEVAKKIIKVSVSRNSKNLTILNTKTPSKES